MSFIIKQYARKGANYVVRYFDNVSSKVKQIMNPPRYEPFWADKPSVFINNKQGKHKLPGRYEAPIMPTLPRISPPPTVNNVCPTIGQILHVMGF